MRKNQRRRIRALRLFGLLVCMGGLIVGCGAVQQGTMENEIFTCQAVSQDKTVITVSVEYVVGDDDELEQTLEEKFPDVDIVLRHNGATNKTYSLRKNLAAGTEEDLIVSGALPYLTKEEAGKYLVNFAAESFPSNYYMSAVDACTDDSGNLYYLPGPSNVYGIVYDKTMFEEYGWKLPHSYSEFAALLKTIRTDTSKAGQKVTPIQVSLMYPDVFQILFNTYGYADVYSGEDNFRWLSSYQKGEGSMVGHMEPAVKKFQTLFADGMLSQDDVNVQPATRSEMLYVEHSAAMIVECQNAVDYVKDKTKGTDAEVHDIAMMPFWTSDEEDSDYLYAIPQYYLGITKKSAEESDEKKQLLLDIMDYLSTEEGQEALMGSDFVLSNVQDVPMISNDFSENIIDTIEKGQVINTFLLADGEDNLQVESKMLEMTPDLMNDKITTKEFLQAADTARDEWLQGTEEETVYGTCETTLTRLETAYTVAEMYADVMDTQIGLCLGGCWNRSTNARLFQGDITQDSLDCISPDKEHQASNTNPDADSIVATELTGAQILAILNNTETIGEKEARNGYYVAYGLTVEYAPWAENGSRVISCKTEDGEDIKEDEVYSVAYFNGSLSLDGLKVLDICGESWNDAFVSWLADKGENLKAPEMTLTLVYDD